MAHETGDGEPEDYFEHRDDGDAEGPDPGSDEAEAGRDFYSVGRIPGIENFLRSTLDPFYNQFRFFERIGEIAASAMPRIPLAGLDFPEIRRIQLHAADSVAAAINFDAVLAPYRNAIDYEAILAPYREAIASLVDWSSLVKSVVDPALVERIRALVEDRLPPNWHDVEDWRDAAAFVQATGWAVIWLPRSEVVAALLAAPDEEREAVLLGYESSILDDAVACADAVQHDDLTFVATCIREIASSTRDGHAMAAQALAGSVLTELIQGVLGHKELRQAREEYAESWEEKSITILRFALITSAVPLALAQFYRQKGDPVPARFNRHAVAHGASPVQFTRVNALVGLILVTSLARELQELYDEGVIDDE